jgi:phenylacetate-CoA ligase
MTETPPRLLMKSALEGILWPAAPGADAAMLAALLRQFDDSQWWTPAELEARQFGQIEALLGHAWRSVPFYRDWLAGAGWQPGETLDADRYAQMPVLTRAAVQAAGERLNSTAVPASHGTISEISTSGSTGRPVTVNVTGWSRLIWMALTMRDHHWQRRDFSARFASIRHFPVDKALGPDGLHRCGWGKPADMLYETGSMFMLNIRHNVSEQLAWLQRVDPAYLLTLPSAAEAMARCCLQRHIRLDRLREVRTLGEMLSPTIRETVREAWGVPVRDIYSAQEVGYMALQAPRDSGDAMHYLVPAETIRVEILDAQGRACRPGEIGRVVVTPLHNFATPLIRYEVGDYAQAGAPSACGRGLPVIERILGRVRNMLILPDGDARWPASGIKSFNREHGERIGQFQVVQKTVRQLHVNLVMASPFPEAEAEALKAHVRARLGYPFDIELVYVDDIPRSKSGKFEDFRSEVAEAR